MYIISQFPFLIGRIRTRETLIKEFTFTNVFPFLIGRIRTIDKVEGKKIPFKFPFLIGRIRTRRK